MNQDLQGTSSELLKKIESELGEIKDQEKKQRITRFIIAAMSSIPWIGGFFGASASLKAELEQSKTNDLIKLWIEEHEAKLSDLGETIHKIIVRFDSFGDSIKDRIQSEEYLQLVRKGFRIWDKADTEDKRELIRKLIANSCAINLSSDDVIRLFMDWIEKYHDSHFYVIKYIYQNPGISRGQIWDMIYDYRPAENSAEADLYKLLIRDLSTGSVIRQYRETNYYGEFVKKSKPKTRGTGSKVMKSAFSDSEPYELTDLGSKFVHYCMEEVVPQIEK